MGASVLRNFIGIPITAVLMIIGSLLWFPTGIDYNRYRHFFSPIAENVLFIRYIVSNAVRILGIIAGVGILFRKDWFRKIAVRLSIFNLATIFLKHPFYIFQRMIVENTAVDKAAAWAVMAIVYAIDIGFACWVIYYFNRDIIKQRFA